MVPIFAISTMPHQCDAARLSTLSHQMRKVAFVLLLTASSNLAATQIVEPSCSPDVAVCEVHLVLEHRYTMMHYSNGGDGTMRPVVAKQDGNFYAKTSCTTETKLTQEEKARVIVGDGSYKMIVAVNGTVPGPTLVVYEGQQMKVVVRNDLENEATSLHFHGLHQRDTPYMDGASGVSQCAINPFESFTYRFVASPAGTHWYHAHLGTQRTMGAYGAFVVLDRSEDDINRKRGWDPLPDFDDEFVAIVQDWMRPTSYDVLNNVLYEAVSYAYGFTDPYCYNSTKQADGMDCGVTPFHSAVVNGKGRHYDWATGEAENGNLPLETYLVQEGGRYRFRVVCASMTFAFRLTIDGHVLNVIATDGNDVINYRTDELVIFSGERYDVWIEATDPQKSGLYWIRFQTLEKTQNGLPITAGHTEAILRYTSSGSGPPYSTPVPCTQTKPCTVLNCPFKDLPSAEHTICTPVTELKSCHDQMLTLDDPDNFQEHIFNFHFTGHDISGSWRPTVNGIQNVLPQKPYQIFPELYDNSTASHSQEFCQDELCSDELVIDVPLDTVLQLTFAITVSNPPGIRNGNTHPIHLHGHQFEVVKIGWPVYDDETKFYQDKSNDLVCEDAFCNHLMWRNNSWMGGNIPGLSTARAPLKDTVMVPVGGYVVTRVKADNPGFWYMHCHTEFHNVEGMSLTIKIGDTSEMPRPPSQLRTCGDFDLGEDLFLEAIRSPVLVQLGIGPTKRGESRVRLNNILQITAGVLGTLCTCLFFLTMSLFCNYRPRRGYRYLAESTTPASSRT